MVVLLGKTQRRRRRRLTHEHPLRQVERVAVRIFVLSVNKARASNVESAR
jgi:hypothetical protein